MILNSDSDSESDYSYDYFDPYGDVNSNDGNFCDSDEWWRIKNY